MKKLWLLCLLLALSADLAAQQRTVRVLTEPDAVDVYLLTSTGKDGGIFLGRSDEPLLLEEQYLKGRGSVDFRLTKDGYFPLEHNFKTVALSEGARLPTNGPLRLPPKQSGASSGLVGLLAGVPAAAGVAFMLSRRKSRPQASEPSQATPPGEWDPLVGRTVCGYTIERIVTRGGMGALYRARKVDGGTEAAAVKVVDLAGQPDEMKGRFFRELTVAAKLHHPGIVRTWDYEVIEERFLAIVMEWLPGADLATMLEGKKLSAVQSVTVLRPIFEALAYLHERRIVHRDVKPANIFVLPDGSCKLIDFGLARDESQVGLTANGMFLGTPQYAPPEQITGQGVKPEGDQYALGLVLYTMLAGRPAFGGDDAMQVLMKQMTENPPPLSEVNPSVTPAFDAALARMIEKDPSLRYPTLSEALAHLEKAL